MEKDQEFVETVVKYLVENPDDVKVDRKVDEMGVLLTLTVNPTDMGKIIGKEGRTAKAIRTLLRVLGARMDARVNLKIEEPEGGTGYQPSNSGENDTAPADAPADAGVNDVTEQPTTNQADDPGFDPLATGSEFLKSDDAAAGADDNKDSGDENPTSIL